MSTEAFNLSQKPVTQWLEWGASQLAFLGGSESRRECERMLETLWGVSRSTLYLEPPRDPRIWPQFSEWVEARKKRVPLAYLLRKADFWEDEFEVEEGVFIPRPETERLVEVFFETNGFTPRDEFLFLDLGTGSGNIAVTLARLFPRARGIATDISDRALAAACRNAEKAGVRDRLEWVRADRMNAFGRQTFQAILSNPPYVRRSEWSGLELEVRQEPEVALDGGADGLDFYREILEGLSCLRQGGSLWLEVGWDQAGRVAGELRKKEFQTVRIFKDWNGIERVVTGINFRG